MKNADHILRSLSPNGVVTERTIQFVLKNKNHDPALAAYVVCAVKCHEEMLQLLKTAYCIVAEAMPQQAPDPAAFVVVQKDWLKRTEQTIAAAEGVTR